MIVRPSPSVRCPVGCEFVSISRYAVEQVFVGRGPVTSHLDGRVVCNHDPMAPEGAAAFDRAVVIPQSEARALLRAGGGPRPPRPGIARSFSPDHVRLSRGVHGHREVVADDLPANRCQGSDETMPIMRGPCWEDQSELLRHMPGGTEKSGSVRELGEGTEPTEGHASCGNGPSPWGAGTRQEGSLAATRD